MTPYLSLSLIFLAMGLSLLAAIAYLARLVRRHRRSLGTLLKLARINLDPLELPAAAWPALADGGIIRLDFSGDWFGQTVQGSFGAAQGDSRPFVFEVVTDGDIHLSFHLCPKAENGEARLFAENLTGVFRLLLETSVHSKMEALSAALSEQARLTLYLQHDLRNLAQWVQWLAADFAEAKNDATLLGVAQRLRVGAPHAALRANHILSATCKVRADTLLAPQTVALGYAIRQAAEHAGISVNIKGDACVLLRRDLLDRTLDNLFTNVAPLLRLHPDLNIAVSIVRKEDKVAASIIMPRLAEVAEIPPEKLFEPFASGRPGGLGLGLYQAHKSLTEAGGELLAEMSDDHVCFSLSLPGAALV
jgi:signal transduction histidine kinase